MDIPRGSQSSPRLYTSRSRSSVFHVSLHIYTFRKQLGYPNLSIYLYRLPRYLAYLTAEMEIACPPTSLFATKKFNAPTAKTRPTVLKVSWVDAYWYSVADGELWKYFFLYFSLNPTPVFSEVVKVDIVTTSVTVIQGLYSPTFTAISVINRMQTYPKLLSYFQNPKL